MFYFLFACTDFLCIFQITIMPKIKPGQSRKGKNRAVGAGSRPTTDSGQLSEDAERALIDRITMSVMSSLPSQQQQDDTSYVNSEVSITGSQASTVAVYNELAGLDTNSLVTEVPCTNSISTPIVAMIDPTLKQKIWQDKYVDLAQLLPQNCSPHSKKHGLQFQLSGDSGL